MAKKKNADFQKQKLKVGKKKPLPTTHTNTSFRSKSIAIPTQSILTRQRTNDLLDSWSTLKSHRGLSISELLKQLTHYQPSTRCDALFGLKEIVGSHMEAITSSSHCISLIINGTTKCMLDDDPSVRSSLLSFYKSMLSLDRPEIVFPYLNSITLYLSASLTHIHEDIRANGLQFLIFWIPFVPKTHSTESLGRLIPALLGILSGDDIKNRSTTKKNSQTSIKVGVESKLASSNVRVGVLEALLTILQHSVEEYEKLNEKSRVSDWNGYDTSWTVNAYAYEGLTGSLSFDTLFTASEAVSSSVSTYNLSNQEDVCRLICDCWRLFKDLWVEFAKSALINPSTSPELQTLMLLVQILNQLWSIYLDFDEFDEDFVFTNAQQITKVMAGEFPFRRYALTSTSVVQKEITGMDENFAQLLSIFVSNLSDYPCGWLPNIVDFITSSLDQEDIAMTSVILSIHGILPHVDEETFDLIISKLLNRFGDKKLKYKYEIAEFFADILYQFYDISENRIQMAVLSQDCATKSLKTFVMNIPRLLFDIGIFDTDLTERFIRLFHHIAIRERLPIQLKTWTLPHLEFDSEAWLKILKSFIPYFKISINGREVIGPFRSLPASTKQLLLDALTCVPYEWPQALKQIVEQEVQ